MYCVAFGTEFIRALVTLLYLHNQTRSLYNLTMVFVFNDCLTLAVFIAMHVFRLIYPGRYCSGDFGDGGELAERGEYLIVLIALGWTVIILSSICLVWIRRL